jgi:hypothetical protein
LGLPNPLVLSICLTKKKAMKNYGLILLLAVLFFGCDEEAQNVTPETTDILGHWIEDPDQTTEAVRVLVPFEEDSSIPFYLKYGGIEFFDDETVLQYYWLKCGNDPHPPATPGTYTITMTPEGEELLQVELPDQLITYIILEATPNILRLQQL